MSRKVILYLGGILLLIIFIIGLIAFLNSRSQQPNPDPNDDITNVDQNDNTDDDIIDDQPIVTPSRISKISEEPVVAPVLSFDGKAVWYFAPDGTAYKVNLDTGLKQEFLIFDKQSVSDIVWPRAGNDFILVHGNGVNRTFRYFNSAITSSTNQITAYPSNFKGVDFTSDAKAILYNWVGNDGKSFLSTGSLNNSTFENIVELPEAGLHIEAGTNLTKALAFNKDNPSNGKLYLILVDQKKVVTLNTGLENTALWSPDGKHFLYNRDPDAAQTGRNLWLGDSTAPIDKNLGIQGSVSKAAFDSIGTSLYLAAPDETGAEVIWKIDLNTLQKTLILKPNSTDTPAVLNITDLMVSPDNTAIFFRNSDGYVYGYKLGQ